MYNDIDWATKNNASICDNVQKSPITPRSFLDTLRSQRQRPSPTKPKGGCSRTAEEMITHFAESGHPVFKGIGPLARGALKSEAGGKVSAQARLIQLSVSSGHKDGNDDGQCLCEKTSE